MCALGSEVRVSVIHKQLTWGEDLTRPQMTVDKHPSLRRSSHCQVSPGTLVYARTLPFTHPFHSISLVGEMNQEKTGRYFRDENRQRRSIWKTCKADVISLPVVVSQNLYKSTYSSTHNLLTTTSSRHRHCERCSSSTVYYIVPKADHRKVTGNGEPKYDARYVRMCVVRPNRILSELPMYIKQCKTTVR